MRDATWLDHINPGCNATVAFRGSLAEGKLQSALPAFAKGQSVLAIADKRGVADAYVLRDPGVGEDVQEPVTDIAWAITWTRGDVGALLALALPGGVLRRDHARRAS